MGYRIGTGFDAHRLIDERSLIIGGVNIPFHKGLDGHSDADVLIHAIMDAILGAAGLPDIGQLFPDTDDRFKGISSILLLQKVIEKISARGFAVVNIDSTVICQEPKLMPYMEEMKSVIAEAIKIDRDMVNIKATTTEKMGFTGREEGIAAQAVCLLMGE